MINETKTWFFEKTFLNDKLLARLIMGRKKKKKAQMKIRNEKEVRNSHCGAVVNESN